MNVAVQQNNRRSTDLGVGTSLTAERTVWDRRYLKDGRLWGGDPSPPARLLAKKLNSDSKILEIGPGYGRDLAFLGNNGHRIFAYDNAVESLTIATQDVKDLISRGQVQYTFGDFRKSPKDGTFDAFYSHKVIHLLGRNGHVDAFANVAAGSLKPGGLLLVTARSMDDFNPEQMRWKDKERAIAVYKDIPELGDRVGQELAFWDEKMLKHYFQEAFENIVIENGQELESVSNLDNEGNQVMTSYISISATKKYPHMNGGPVV